MTGRRPVGTQVRTRRSARRRVGHGHESGRREFPARHEEPALQRPQRLEHRRGRRRRCRKQRGGRESSARVRRAQPAGAGRLHQPDEHALPGRRGARRCCSTRWAACWRAAPRAPPATAISSRSRQTRTAARTRPSATAVAASIRRPATCSAGDVIFDLERGRYVLVGDTVTPPNDPADGAHGDLDRHAASAGDARRTLYIKRREADLDRDIRRDRTSGIAEPRHAAPFRGSIQARASSSETSGPDTANVRVSADLRPVGAGDEDSPDRVGRAQPRRDRDESETQAEARRRVRRGAPAASRTTATTETNSAGQHADRGLRPIRARRDAHRRPSHPRTSCAASPATRSTSGLVQPRTRAASCRSGSGRARAHRQGRGRGVEEGTRHPGGREAAMPLAEERAGEVRHAEAEAQAAA